MLTQTVGLIGRVAAAPDPIEGVETAFVYGIMGGEVRGRTRAAARHRRPPPRAIGTNAG